MERPTSRWARIGPTDRKWLVHVPPRGLCLSAFVLVRNRKGDLLLGRPRPHRNWPEKGGVGIWRIRDIAKEGSWTLPASHLLLGEDPAAAAIRVARVWGGVADPRPHLVGIDSCRMGLERRKGSGGRPRESFHWAVGFVYELTTSRVPRKDPGWEELRFFPVVQLESVPIGRQHGDFLKYLSSKP